MIKYPRTTSERAVGVVPVRTDFPPGDVRRYGAIGNGMTDDAPAIDTASRVAAVLGGVVYLPPGRFLLGTLSADSEAHSCYITARDNVSIVGADRAVSILAVKGGENLRFRDDNAPFVIATGKRSPLTNCVFADFSVDWGGSQNVLTEDMARRNNASLYTAHGAANVHVLRVRVLGTPGDQCIFVNSTPQSWASNRGGPVSVRACEFINSGSGLRGNVNVDHSSVYLLCDNALVEECIFQAEELVSGACYELHGNSSSGRGNKSYNYYRGFWLASDFDSITAQSVDGDDHREVVCSFDIAAPKFGMDKISIANSVFRQSSRHPVEDRHYFSTSHTVKRLGNLEIRNCTFSGCNSKNSRLMALYNVARFAFVANTVESFNDGTEGYGIVSANGDIGGGRIATDVEIGGNAFMDVVTPISIQPSRYGVCKLAIRDNKFYSRTAVKGGAVRLNLSGGTGEVSGNRFHRNFSVPCVRIDGSSAVRDMDDLVGSLGFPRTRIPASGEVQFEVPVRGVTTGFYASASANCEHSMISLRAEAVSAGVVSVTATNVTDQYLEFGPGVLQVAAARELTDGEVRELGF